MKIPKTKIKKMLKKKITFNQTIPNEVVKMLVKESYLKFVLNRLRMFGHIPTDSFEFYGNFDRFCFEGADNMEHHFEIQKDGSIEDITEEVRQQYEADMDTKEEALKS